MNDEQPTEIDPNPFQAPQTTGRHRRRIKPVPPEVDKRIYLATGAATFSGLITVALILSGPREMMWYWLDVGLVFGLAVGMFLRSRTCAILMLAYFLLSKLILPPSDLGWIVAAAFGLLYVNGVRGTYQYHMWRHDQEKRLLRAAAHSDDLQTDWPDPRQ